MPVNLHRVGAAKFKQIRDRLLQLGVEVSKTDGRPRKVGEFTVRWVGPGEEK
jgi:hypothetical protein